MPYPIQAASLIHQDEDLHYKRLAILDRDQRRFRSRIPLGPIFDGDNMHFTCIVKPMAMNWMSEHFVRVIVDGPKGLRSHSDVGHLVIQLHDVEESMLESLNRLNRGFLFIYIFVMKRAGCNLHNFGAPSLCRRLHSPSHQGRPYQPLILDYRHLQGVQGPFDTNVSGVSTRNNHNPDRGRSSSKHWSSY